VPIQNFLRPRGGIFGGGRNLLKRAAVGDGYVVSHTSEQLVYADGGREPTSPAVVPKRKLSLRNRHAVRLRENSHLRSFKGI